MAQQVAMVFDGIQQRRHGSRLVLEVEVERRSGDAGALGDVGDVESIEAGLPKVVVQRLEDRAAPQIAFLRLAPVGRRPHR